MKVIFLGGGFQGKGHFSIVFTISILAKDLMVTFVVFVPRALSHIPHWSHSNQIPSNRPLLLLLPLQSSPWRAGKGNWREKRSLDDGVTPRGKLSLTHTLTLSRTNPNKLSRGISVGFPTPHELKALVRYIGGWPNSFPRPIRKVLFQMRS